MPHQSLRLSIGKSPPDLRREAWDPDKSNLEREGCKVLLTEQRLLICHAVGNVSKLARAATLPTKKLSVATLPSLIGRKLSIHSSDKPSNAQNEQADVPMDYKVVGKISPENKDKGTFDLPEGLLPLKCACGNETSLEVIQVVEDYLRRKRKRRDWEVIGVLPGIGHNEHDNRHDNGTQRSSSPSTSTTFASSTSASSDRIAPHCNKHPWPVENPQPKHFVLIERTYRCNCEKSYRPRHKLKVDYKPGYTPATPEEREMAHAKWKKQQAQSNAAAAGGGAVAAVAACGGGC